MIELALSAIPLAAELDLSEVACRSPSIDERRWVQTWPGEHYRLLATLAQASAAQSIVEIGTFTGLGSLSLLAGAHPKAKVVTYDVIPWDQIPGSALRHDDFGPRLEQRIGDLSDPDYFAAQRETLAAADLVFLDGPKDGDFEPAFLRLLLEHVVPSGGVMVVDDTRLLPMIRVWRDLPLPKLDLTGFGHWSGTGIVELSA